MIIFFTEKAEKSTDESSDEEGDNLTPDFSDIRGEGIGHDMSSDSSSGEEDEIVDFEDLQEVRQLFHWLYSYLNSSFFFPFSILGASQPRSQCNLGFTMFLNHYKFRKHDFYRKEFILQ